MRDMCKCVKDTSKLLEKGKKSPVVVKLLYRIGMLYKYYKKHMKEMSDLYEGMYQDCLYNKSNVCSKLPSTVGGKRQVCRLSNCPFFN